MLDVLPHLRPSRHVHATVTDQGAMLLDLRGRGHWYALSPSAAQWWEHLATGASATEAADAVAASYGAPTARVRTDIQGLISELCRRRLLERRE